MSETKEYMVIIEAYKTFGALQHVVQFVVVIRATNGDALLSEINKHKSSIFVHGHQPDYTLVKQVIEIS